MIGRKEKNGPQGDGVNEEVSFTLTGTDHHAVAMPDGKHYSASKNSFFMHTAEEQANTLVATDWKDPPILNDTPNDEPLYIVRRLTPVECARLQGWTDDSHVNAAVVNSDSQLYKQYGNGVTVSVVYEIAKKLAELEGMEAGKETGGNGHGG